MVIESQLPDHDFTAEFAIPADMEYRIQEEEDKSEKPAEVAVVDWLQLAKQYKEKANSLFRIHEDSSLAAQDYKRALHCLRRVSKTNQEVCALRVVLYVNLSACDLTAQNYAACRKHTSKALKHDPTNLKALYRRSVARRYAGFDLEGAEKDLILAVEQNGKETESLKRSLEALRRDRAKAKAAEVDAAKRMFKA